MRRGMSLALGICVLVACGGGREVNTATTEPRQGEMGGTGGQAGTGGRETGTAGKEEGTLDPRCNDPLQCTDFKTMPGQGEPPAATPGAGPAEGSAVVYAFDRLLLGETDREGKVGDQFWKLYGFNQDGFQSTPAQGIHCAPLGDGKKSLIRQDGEDGIDNGWGHSIASEVLMWLFDSPSSEATALLMEGRESWLIDVGALGAQASYASLTGGFGRAQGTLIEEKLVAPPTSDWSSYTWHPLQGSRVAFSQAYLTNHLLVARFDEPVVMSLFLEGSGLMFPVRRMALVVDVSDRTRGMKGTLGGLIPTEEMVAMVQKTSGALDTRFCDPNGTAMAGLLNAVRSASDSLLDGGQDPMKKCDAISFGVGFTARATTRGAEVMVPTPPDPCAL